MGTELNSVFRGAVGTCLKRIPQVQLQALRNESASPNSDITPLDVTPLDAAEEVRRLGSVSRAGREGAHKAEEGAPKLIMNAPLNTVIRILCFSIKL